MHFRPVEQPMDDEYLAQGGGGGSGGSDSDHGAELEAGPGSGPGGGVYFSLDDVFGPESESGSASGRDAAQATAADVTSLYRPESPRHPSDMRRLETEHTTAGYREGISAAKERTVQAGFDEGFSLGATIGLAAGQLLGTLEGIDDALKTRLDGRRTGSEGEAAASRLLAEARQELSVPKIFSSEHWAPDGNWSFDVEPEAGDGDGDEVLFSDVAKAHPLIGKWTAIVDDQIRLWKIDRSVLDGEDGDARTEGAADDAATRAGASGGTGNSMPLPPPASRQPLDW
ncbi:abc1 domain-containing [Trichoderma cornu-damae]|uniref:Protein YAE1 n=1 Tax=Trichoderma cornu-damae TaxID=654480 RepID=A0A9P8QIU7_9HYPO|nr:abc1 domain-containing [Trichoderma cornu-damae]